MVLILALLELPFPGPAPSQEAQLSDHGQARTDGRHNPITDSPPTARAQQTVEHKPSSKEISGKLHDSESSCWLSLLSASDVIQLFFNLLMTVATVAVAIFTYQMVGINRDVHKATADAAGTALDSVTVAQESVEISKLALLSDRPYLLIDDAKILGWQIKDIGYPNAPPSPETVPLLVEFSMQNYGKGPAIIEEILTCVIARPPQQLPAPRDYGQCVPVPLSSVRIVAPGQPSPFRTDSHDGLTVSARRAELSTGQEHLIAYGCVRYQDTAHRRWETGFLWMFHPAGVQWGDAQRFSQEYMYPGPYPFPLLYHYRT